MSFFLCVCVRVCVRECLCVCLNEAQRANEGGVDSLMSPPRKQVQGKTAYFFITLFHSLCLSFAFLSSANFTPFTFPVGYLVIHSDPSISDTQTQPQTLQLVAKP